MLCRYTYIYVVVVLIATIVPVQMSLLRHRFEMGFQLRGGVKDVSQFST